MISHWKVVRQVAERYGRKEADFEAALHQLQQVKAGNIPLVRTWETRTGLQVQAVMEEADAANEKEAARASVRVHNRMLREHLPTPLAIERINGINNFQDTYVLDKLADMAQAVCRLVRNGTPIGTGFLVAEDLLITNHHVIERPEQAENMLAEFDFELDRSLTPKPPARFRLDPQKFFLTSSLELERSIPNTGLDFTIIGVAQTGLLQERLNRYRPICLDGNLGKIIKGESCVIIQHPGGLPKKVVLKDIAFFSETGTRLIYESDTLPGSSGAAVIALGTCEIIALHHAGVPRTDDQNRILTKAGAIADAQTPDHEIDWIGNAGIKVSRIMQAVREAVLPAHMEKGRQALLLKTKDIAGELAESPLAVPVHHTPADKPLSTTTDMNHTAPNTSAQGPLDTFPGSRAAFLLTARNDSQTIARIETALRIRYGTGYSLSLLMPGAAVEGETELFGLQAPFRGNVHEEALALRNIPEVIAAEADIPLYLNSDTSLVAHRRASGMTTEAGELYDDGTGKWNEEEFLEKYGKSPYVKGKSAAEHRRWNWEASRFDKALRKENIASPTKAGIRMVQFDTGYSNHSKVRGGFDLLQDYNFLSDWDLDPTDATDPLTPGFLKHPGHGTRTGSILIGQTLPAIANDGNHGLLTQFDFKLVPYRIAETVVIINRQRQLAAALDRAISQGFDIITMSMGLPPTIATSKMAKKAYDKGIIWCCAAGNKVQAVVAPAVFPGTVAVAASNPFDSDWPGSSRGDSVDITAPGEDVYVPILQEDTWEENFSYGDGTSYAVPHVAAAAACWLAAYREQLSQPVYQGWRRVEAFRQALAKSANRKNKLPRKGFGHGLLDADALLKTPPVPPKESDYAYSKWNERAFFDTLQGYGEMLKTYWNRIHGWAFGTARGGQEALGIEDYSLSPTSRQLEKGLFPDTQHPFEASGTEDLPTLLKRFQTLQQFVEKETK